MRPGLTLNRQRGRWLAWLAAMLLVVSACGDSSSTDTTAAGPGRGDEGTTTTAALVETTTRTSLEPTTTAGPESANAEAADCDELADLFLSINQQFLDDLGDTPAEDFEALMGPLFEGEGALAPPVAKLVAGGDALRVRMDEIECTDEELQRLAFSRADRLEARGPAGELWISILMEDDAPAELSPAPAEEVTAMVGAGGWLIEPAGMTDTGSGVALTITNRDDKPRQPVVADLFDGEPSDLPLRDGIVDLRQGGVSDPDEEPGVAHFGLA